MQITIRNFADLQLQELYDLLQLRSEIFVVEQNCVYQDIDGKDQQAFHVLGYKNDSLVAYTRFFAPGLYFKEPAIGRVLVRKTDRMNSYGHEILKASIEALENAFPGTSIKLSAQTYLTAFYEAHGFKQIGDGYLEDGIPHIGMLRE